MVVLMPIPSSLCEWQKRDIIATLSGEIKSAADRRMLVLKLARKHNVSDNTIYTTWRIHDRGYR